MKKTLLFMMAGMAILFSAACNKVQEEITPEENGPVVITATIDPETKATLNNTSGLFAFSSEDAIKVCNESGTYTGTTTSTGNSGTFTMADGFIGSTDGIAGFPASSVFAMTTGSVTFNLPATYDYDDVGGNDPSAAKVPCPMIGYYDASEKKVTFKQAGAVVRFRLTNIAAGSLSITFKTLVTGKVTLSTVSTADDGGILAANIQSGTYDGRGNTVTINNVPAVTFPNYIYITLPLPTSTAPEDIYFSNTPSNGSLNPRMQVVEGTSTGIVRAGGYRLTASLFEVPSPEFKVADLGGGSYRKVVLAPGNLMAKIGKFYNLDDTGLDTKPTGTDQALSYATASEWKFGDYLQYLGGDPTQGNYLLTTHQKSCEGTWVDLFCWQGASATQKVQGLFTAIHTSYYSGSSTYSKASEEKQALYDARNSAYFGTSTEGLYPGCWNTDKDSYPDDAITISNGGSYKWRPLTQAEWAYLLKDRPNSTFNTVENANFAPVKIEGVNGLLIFPDNVATIWTEDTKTTMGNYPNYINNTNSFTWAGATSYTHKNLLALASAGFVFLPAAGFRYGSGASGYDKEKPYGIVNCDNTFGYYWSSNAAGRDDGKVAAYYVEYKQGSIEWDALYLRACGRSVRLAREVE